jgi:hypothetical protein
MRAAEKVRRELEEGLVSSVQWKIFGALVLAAPFVLFAVLLALSPAAAGAFAGSMLARISDPFVLIGIIISGFAGAGGARWHWALGIGVTVGVAGCLLGYAWWEKVAGGTVATQTAWLFLVWSMFFAFYGFVAGRLGPVDIHLSAMAAAARLIIAEKL